MVAFHGMQGVLTGGSAGKEKMSRQAKVIVHLQIILIVAVHNLRQGAGGDLELAAGQGQKPDVEQFVGRPGDQGQYIEYERHHVHIIPLQGRQGDPGRGVLDLAGLIPIDQLVFLSRVGVEAHEHTFEDGQNVHHVAEAAGLYGIRYGIAQNIY